MRLKIECKVLNNNPVLSRNYRSRINKFIYNSLGEYGNSIHESKQISTFCFSTIKHDGKAVKANIFNIRKFSFEISTIDINIRNIIFSLKNTMHYFSNTFFFKIENIILLEMDNIEDKELYAEFLETKKSIGESGNETIISYYPNEEGFKEAIFKNLIKKYQLVTGDNKIFDTSKMNISFNYTGTKKEQGVEHLSQKDKVIKYFKLIFKLDCPEELKRIAYILGIGEKNNLGFGYIKIV